MPSGERVYTLRSADAPYRALVEQMQEGAVTLNSERRHRLLQPALRGAGRRRRCSRSSARSIDQFVDEGDRHGADARSLATVPASSARACGHRARPPLDVHISVSQVTLDDVEHRTLIVTDMSTLTKVQRESQSKDEFLAMLAHELRNPLGAIGGAVQVLEPGRTFGSPALYARATSSSGRCCTWRAWWTTCSTSAGS